MSVTRETYTPDNLVVSTIYTVMTEDVTVAANTELVRGEVIEYDSATNTIVKPSATIDPTKAYGIIAENVPTSTSTQKSIIYLTGEFNSKFVKLPAGKTVNDYKDTLRKLGIFLR